MAQQVENLPAVQEMQVHPWGGKIPWRRKWQPTPGKSRTEEPGGLQSMEPRRVNMTEHAPAERRNKYSYFGQADRGNIRYVH